MATIALPGAGGLALQPQTLAVSTDVPDGYTAVIYGSLSITSSSVTLTVSGTGQLIITNVIYSG